MLQTRTIEELQNTYFAGLTQAGTGLVLDRRQGSLAYTLSRASAAIAASQDNRMLALERDSSLLTAVGTRLDELGAPISNREQPVRATGFVMAISKTQPVVINTNTSLVHLPTGLQFTTNNSVSVLNLYEVSIPVTAVEFGSSSNLVAGTPLYSPTYPDVCFHVGSSRTDAYYGDLLGGRDTESDETYRQRLLQTYAEGPSSSERNLLRKLLTYPLVERAFVRTRVAGVVEIWVDAATLYTESQRTEMLNYVRTYLAAGAVPTLLQAKRRSVSLTLDVKPFASSAEDLSQLSRRLTSVITSFFSALELGQPLSLQGLIQTLAPLVKEVFITYPTQDVTCGFNEILVPGEIKFTFPSSY